MLKLLPEFQTSLIRVMQTCSIIRAELAVSKIWAKHKQNFGQALVNCLQIILLTSKYNYFSFLLSKFARIFSSVVSLFLFLYFLLEFSPEYCPNSFRILPEFLASIFFWGGGGTVPTACPPPHLLRLCLGFRFSEHTLSRSTLHFILPACLTTLCIAYLWSVSFCLALLYHTTLSRVYNFTLNHR